MLNAAVPPPEPVAPLSTPVTVTEAHWGRVPRFYIETTKDQAIGPAQQKRLYTAMPVKRVFTLESGHIP
jgi:hypothetical protein